MKKVKFDARYGHMQALVLGKKTQFHSVEKSLIRQFEAHPKGRPEALGFPLDDTHSITVHLNDGAHFFYRPKYEIGEIVEVVDSNGKCHAHIKITGIDIQRLANPSCAEMLNEGFSIIRLNDLRHYCYPDIENECLIYFRSYQQCWLSFLYRTMDSDIVLNNPYAVVYQFELMRD